MRAPDLVDAFKANLIRNPVHILVLPCTLNDPVSGTRANLGEKADVQRHSKSGGDKKN
jgi:hypothetical protein